MAIPTVLDLLKNRNPMVRGFVEAVAANAPEVNRFAAKVIDDLTYQTLVRTGFPTVGFSRLNEGFTPSKSTVEFKEFNLLPFGGRIEADKRIADKWKSPSGQRGGPAGAAALFDFEGTGIVRSSLVKVGKQCWYGTGNDAKGFPGAQAFTPFGGTYNLSAAGTTANTASSVYFVKMCQSEEDYEGAALLYGGGDIFKLAEPRIESLLDANSLKYDGLVSQMDGWVGLAFGVDYCVVRICNLTADSGKGMTDALGAQALQLFPDGVLPDVCFMGRRSLEQLRVSRSTTSVVAGTLTGGGSELQAPIPTTIHGIPIVNSGSILATDPIES